MPGCAQLHRLHEFVLVVRCRQDDDARLVPGRLQALQGRQPVQARHLQIQQQDVRLELLQYIQHLTAVLSLRHHLEVFLQRQQPAKSVPEDRMVVGHHDADLRLGRVGAVSTR